MKDPSCRSFFFNIFLRVFPSFFPVGNYGAVNEGKCRAISHGQRWGLAYVCLPRGGALLLQVFAGFVTWRASRITQAEADMTVQRQTLKRGVAKVGICRWSNDLLASQVCCARRSALANTSIPQPIRELIRRILNIRMALA